MALWLVALVLVANGFAQSGAGAIQGTVTDAGSAAVRAAAVHVVNTATGVAHDTVTNNVGFYSVPGLFAGEYKITVSAQGFKVTEQMIALQAAQTANVSPSLAVGAATEKVEVEAEAIQLATYDSPTVSSQLDATSISQIPENGRSVANLLSIVTPDTFSGARPMMNGAMWQATSLVQDGSTNVDMNYGGTLVAQPDVDSMQEVKVEANSSTAKYSAPQTAIVTTKSGTNAFHGSMFETAVNNYFSGARSRSTPLNYTAPHYVRNEFGASLGGPILIPHLYDGKNRSFFFFAYERYSLRSGPYANSSVPTEAMRNGDFSVALNSNGVLQTIYDPATTDPTTWSRQAFANNTISSTRKSPLAKVVDAITPLPTNASNPLVASNISYKAVSNNTTPTITTRVDHTFSPNTNAYARFSSILQNTVQVYASNQRPPSIAGASIPAGASNLVGAHQPEYTAALGLTHIFSPTLVSQTVFGGTWETEWYNMPPVGGMTNFEAQLGLPNNFGALGMPGVSGTIYPLTATQINWGGGEVILTMNEDLTKTFGKHQFYFGGRFGYTQLGTLPDRSADTTSFGSQGTGIYDPSTGTNLGQKGNTGLANADMYLGAAASYNVRLQPAYEHWRAEQYAAYMQDDFHMTRKLTINLGLRWEGLPAPIEVNNLVNGFDQKNKAVVLGDTPQNMIAKKRTTQGIITNLQNLGVVFETPQQAGLPEHIMHGTFGLFEPRIGFAYSLLGAGRGTVVRAGFGRYSFMMPMRDIYAQIGGNAPYSQTYTQSYTSGSQSPDGLNNYLLRSNPTVVAGQNSSGVIDTSSSTAILPGIREVVPDANTPPNMMWQLNTTIEQPLRPSSVLRVSYVYNYSNNLDQQYSYNNAMSSYVWDATTGTTPPGGTYSSVALNPFDNKTYGTLINIQPTGWSTYNALQANFQRLFKNGYGYQISYAYRKGMRVGGNGNRDTTLYPIGDYMPGMVPGNGSLHDLNRAQNYGVYSAFGPQSIAWNGVVDLPVGRGKRYFGKVNRLVDELIGGYQIAYNGSAWVNWMGVNSGNWGGVNPQGTGTKGNIEVYKHKYKVTDCSGSTCRKGYLWYNGFISPVLLNNPCNAALTISGVPSTYQAYQTPVNMTSGGYTCKNGVYADSNTHYLDNQVPVKLANGSSTYVGYSPGPATNPFTKTYLWSPWFWNTDVSIFKVFPIKDKISLRVNVDAFNAFNVQGDNAPASNGIQYFDSSHNTPRQLQFTIRLNY